MLEGHHSPKDETSPHTMILQGDENYHKHYDTNHLYGKLRAVCAPLSAGCSFMESANCKGCCCRRSTTSFQSSRSCLTRSSCDSMCCCEIWSSRSTLWSAFFAIISRMLRKRCEQRCRQALSTRKDMFSAHSSQPSNSTSASLWSTPST